MPTKCAVRFLPRRGAVWIAGHHQHQHHHNVPPSKQRVFASSSLPSQHISKSGCSRRSQSTNTSQSNDSVEEQQTQRRPTTVRERVTRFPTSVQKLWKDWLLYQNIRDAAWHTPRNAWTVVHLDQQVQHAEDSCAAHLSPQQQQQQLISASTTTTKQTVGRIPWPQLQQQRRFVDGISTVLPVVVLWLIPIVGYVPMFVAIAAPRQLLSRHFHNQHEEIEYSRLAYQQRHARFAAVHELFLAQLPLSEEALACYIHQWRSEGHHTCDVAGPVLDNIWPWYQFAFADGKCLSSIDKLPRKYLVELALAVGVYQTFPAAMSVGLARISPTSWLRRQVRHIATTVQDDDTALLQHGSRSVVATLSEIEVVDACLLRGLPVVDTTVSQMRACLVNHLRMIETWKKQLRRVMEEDPHLPVNVETVGLFTLHLAILRENLVESSKDYSSSEKE